MAQNRSSGPRGAQPAKRGKTKGAVSRTAPTADNGAPYAGLTPDVVLDALESVGLRGDGRLLSLNSYENRVYQVHLEQGDSVVAKFYRAARWSDAQILEEHAFAGELAAREIPVVAPMVLAAAGAKKSAARVTAAARASAAAADAEAAPSGGAARSTLHAFSGFRFTVYPRRGGRAPELDNEDTLRWLGRFIARIHAVGASKPFRTRPPLDLETFGQEPRDWLIDHDFIPADLLESWENAVELALDGVDEAFDRVDDARQIRLHGDCHSGNVLWTDGGPHFVDFDDCRTGPAVQDLWMLLSGERAAAEIQLRALLQGYREFHEFDVRELGLIEALRTLRLIHYSAWIARRWDDPAFPAAFPWFNTQRYWQDRILELREQIAAMQESPLRLP